MDIPINSQKFNELIALKEKVTKEVEQSLVIPENKRRNNNLFLFFGIPGSGKSTLAKVIAEVIPCVYLSSDMIALNHNLDQTRNYYWTFEIMNDLANKYLHAGYNVIVDSNSDRYSIRKELYEMAFRHNAKPFCFWVKTDISTVKRRQNIRKIYKSTLRSKFLFYVNSNEIEKYHKDLETPREDENIFTIDGTKGLLNQLYPIEEIRGLIDSK